MNEMVANWVSQNLVPGAKVESMEIDRRYVEQLNPNLCLGENRMMSSQELIKHDQTTQLIKKALFHFLVVFSFKK